MMMVGAVVVVWAAEMQKCKAENVKAFSSTKLLETEDLKSNLLFPTGKKL